MLGVADVSFEDYTIEVQTKIADLIEPALEECAGEIVSQTKRNSRVDTGYIPGAAREAP